jgi:hypothetical protein
MALCSVRGVLGLGVGVAFVGVCLARSFACANSSRVFSRRENRAWN